MNRRNFLNSLIGGVAASAAVRTWPFRVFSFSSTPRLSTLAEQYRSGVLGKSLEFEWAFDETLPIGAIVTMQTPVRLLNPKHATLIEREVVVINSWNPRTEQLIVTRGKMETLNARSR